MDSAEADSRQSARVTLSLVSEPTERFLLLLLRAWLRTCLTSVGQCTVGLLPQLLQLAAARCERARMPCEAAAPAQPTSERRTRMGPSSFLSLTTSSPAVSPFCHAHVLPQLGRCLATNIHLECSCTAWSRAWTCVCGGASCWGFTTTRACSRWGSGMGSTGGQPLKWRERWRRRKDTADGMNPVESAP